MIAHTVIAICIQCLCMLVGFSSFAGALGATLYFLGREIAQAEYRVIYSHYGRKRANAPWWCGFELRAWTLKGVLDWVVPMLIVGLISIVEYLYAVK